MIPRNHGLLTVGPSLPEAFNFMYGTGALVPGAGRRDGGQYRAQLPAAGGRRQGGGDVRAGRHPALTVLLEWPALLRELDRLDPSCVSGLGGAANARWPCLGNRSPPLAGGRLGCGHLKAVPVGLGFEARHDPPPYLPRKGGGAGFAEGANPLYPEACLDPSARGARLQRLAGAADRVLRRPGCSASPAARPSARTRRTGGAGADRRVPHGACATPSGSTPGSRASRRSSASRRSRGRNRTRFWAVSGPASSTRRW